MSPSPRKEPQASLKFPCSPPRHFPTEGANFCPARRGGWRRGAHIAASREPAAPGRARPSPRGACDTRASAAPSASSARLPFKREAQLDLCRPRRGATPLYGGVGGSGSDNRGGWASRAGGRASGCRPPSPQRGRGERGARRRGGGRVGGPGRAGGVEAGEGGEPGLQRSGPPLTAARRGDV